jgi:hypothetical protein
MTSTLTEHYPISFSTFIELHELLWSKKGEIVRFIDVTIMWLVHSHLGACVQQFLRNTIVVLVAVTVAVAAVAAMWARKTRTSACSTPIFLFAFLAA